MANVYKKLTMQELLELTSGEHILVSKPDEFEKRPALIRDTTSGKYLAIVTVHDQQLQTMSLPLDAYQTTWFAEKLVTIKLNIDGVNSVHIGANDEELNISVDVTASDAKSAKAIAARASDAIYEAILSPSIGNLHAKAICALISTGAIEFKTTGGWGGEKDVFVKTDLFTDTEFHFGVSEDDWNDSPSMAVATAIANLLRENKLTYKPFSHHESEV